MTAGRLAGTVRARVRVRGAVGFAAALCWLATSAAPGGEPGLTLSDLAPYRAALEPKPPGTATASAESVTFRDLWGHPERYTGRRVRVEGRVARRFRQAAFGTFPPLVEVWAVAPSGDPFCLVFPAGPGDSKAAPGASVRFEGTFLRQLRYQGGDAPRLAPLIVGPSAPAVTTAAAATATGKFPGSAWPAMGPRSWSDWAVGLAAAGVVGLVLARRHWSAPPPRPTRGRRGDDGKPPEFLE